MQRLVLVLVLVALLAATVAFAAYAWVALGDADISVAGYTAMGFGILLTVVVGCGLMALVFYSSRRGYDEAAHRSDDRDR